MPFSDLKPLTAKYIHQVWRKERAGAVIVLNKRHEILPKLLDRLLSFCKTRKKTKRLHIGHSYLTHFFILKRKKRNHQFVLHVIKIKDIMTECAELVEVRKKHLEDRPLYSLFQNVNPEKMFYFLIETGMFYRI